MTEHEERLGGRVSRGVLGIDHGEAHQGISGGQVDSQALRVWRWESWEAGMERHRVEQKLMKCPESWADKSGHQFCLDTGQPSQKCKKKRHVMICLTGR